MNEHGEMILYTAAEGPAVEVRLERETVWLTQKQMALLFDIERSVITKHIKNIIQTAELQEVAVCARNAHTAADGKKYATTFYNLDMIISVGYRVNSKRGVQFRQWAARVLRDHLVRGYTVNEKRLVELRQSVRLVAAVLKQHEISGDEAKSLLRVVADFANALDLLDDYDHQRVTSVSGTPGAVMGISYDEAIRIIASLKKKFSASVHFGVEKDDSLKSSLAAVFQTAGGRDVYPTMEDKAANLLYFLVKNHSFVDGNKRIAAALFLWFLEKNSRLYRKDGGKSLADATLVAVTLMIATSRPAERKNILSIVTCLLAMESPS